MFESLLSGQRNTPIHVKTTLLLHFNGSEGDRVTTDETGKACTFIGDDALALRARNAVFPPTALSVNGGASNSHLLIDSLDILPNDIDSPFTIDFSYQIATSPINKRYELFTWGDLKISTNPGTQTLHIEDGGGIYMAAYAAIDNNSHKFRLMRMERTLYAYVDGKLKTSQAVPRNFSKNVVKILNNTVVDSSTVFDIVIDELRVSNVIRDIGAYVPSSVPFELD